MYTYFLDYGKIIYLEECEVHLSVRVALATWYIGRL